MCRSAALPSVYRQARISWISLITHKLAESGARGRSTGRRLIQIFRLVPGKSASLLIDLPDSIATVPGGCTLLVTFADKSTSAYLLTIEKRGS